MIEALLTLLGFELLGELLRSTLHLPVPGPVAGMLLLTAALVLRHRATGTPANPPAETALDRVSGVLLDHMGLLFVPAGAGIIAEGALLRQEWLPIIAALIGSTVLSLAVTGLVMHHIIRTQAEAAP
ncbi:MAG: CidA/LrgA family protein [Acidocella sp.]|nr:CidA/LrgA family protein [Acidocella sp.]